VRVVRVVRVVRNDAIDLAAIATISPTLIVISRGPCAPEAASVSVAAIRAFAGKLPIPGVCLGYQAIGQAFGFGGCILHADRSMHGKTSPVLHKGHGVFAGLPSRFRATRYHSLAIERTSLPDCLEIAAASEHDENKARPEYLVQNELR
jgi:anthranilate synthase component 2